MKAIILFITCLLVFNANGKTRFVRVVFSGDASTTATVIWDQKRGQFMGFYMDTVEPFKNRYRQEIQLTSKNNWKGMSNCLVELKNLRPNTKYYFTIKDSEGFGRTYYFSTAPNVPEERLSLIGGGDSRDNRPVRVKANKMVAKLKAHAVLFNGDFINLDLNQQWINWFEDWEYTIDTDGRITPLVVSRGNHEKTNKVIVRLFNVPHPKLYYHTTLGGNLLNLISLNSEILKIGGQKVFLRNTLEEHKDFFWQLPQYHRPIRAHVSFKKEMQTQYKNFVPLFEQYKNVRLCLENDSHTTKITWPILSSKEKDADEGFKRNDEKGIVYAGEGCWGAPLRDADDCKSWTRDAGKVNQFNWIFISKEKIEQITSLTEATRFTIPEFIDLFGPKNGTLVEIFPQKDK
jgi:acid phosphatase type 7